MIELLRAHAPLIALLVGLGGLIMVSMTASQPLLAHQRHPVDGRTGVLAVQIGGTLDGPLRPGGTRHLDLTLTNPSAQDVITSVSVSVTSVSTRDAAGARPCLTGDFETRPGRLGSLAVAADGAVTLSTAGVPRADWPAVHMVNAPVSQDACRGAELSLTYQAEGVVR